MTANRPGRRVLVTGASSGLGLRCAHVLASRRYRLVLAGVDEPGNVAAARTLQNDHPGVDVTTVTLDLGSLEQVRTTAADLADSCTTAGSFDAIVANAGIQLVDASRVSSDGYERVFAVNYLGHYLLVRNLLGALAPQGRVVLVASGTHYGEFRTNLGFPGPRWRDPNELLEPRNEDGAVVYATSKLATIYFSYELARRLPPGTATVNAFDPGLMPGTGLAADRNRLERWLWRNIMPALRFLPTITVSTPARSGEALADLVTDPALLHTTGRYFEIDRIRDSSAESRDRGRARHLFDWTESLLGPALMPNAVTARRAALADRAERPSDGRIP